jgi:DNA-binding FrmR family transcriptional regulator
VNTSDSGGLDAAEVEDLLRRLSRIEGQIRGIKKMVMEGRDCRELVTQFSAVSKALEQAALNYVTAQLVYCIEDPDAASANGYTLDDVKRLLARLR